MSNGDLKNTPHPISFDKWWYEEPEGITVLALIVHPDAANDITEVFIPWKDIRAALKRKDKKHE